MNNLEIKLKQEYKWASLNEFFHHNSKYYKKIDNGNILFVVGYTDTTPFANIFLNNLSGFTFKNKLLPEEIRNFLSYHENTWANKNVNYVYNPLFLQDHSATTNQACCLLPKSFRLYKTLDTSAGLSEEVDDNLKDFFSGERQVNNSTYFISRHLPVIPCFYYKNLEKVKIVKIGHRDLYTNYVLWFLEAIKLGYLKDESALRKSIENQGPISILAKFDELRQEVSIDEFTYGPILLSLLDNQWMALPNLQRKLSVILNNSDSRLNTKLRIDTATHLTVELHSSMMDFPVFQDNLYNLDYDSLFSFQYWEDVEKAIEATSAMYNLYYYREDLKKYWDVTDVLLCKMATSLVTILNRFIYD